MTLTKNEYRHLVNQIRKEVSFFNGWRVSEDREREACEKAADRAIRYLEKKFFDEYGSNA